MANEDVKERWEKFQLMKSILFFYNRGFREVKIDLKDTYLCSCGKLLVFDSDIGKHMRMGHSLKRIKGWLIIKMETKIEEAD